MRRYPRACLTRIKPLAGRKVSGKVPPAMADHIKVQTATGSEREAERIAAALVERRLAACVQVLGPVASRYRWRGEVEQARAVLTSLLQLADERGEAYSYVL